MALPAIPSGALLALLAAASWGGGDFSGGMGSKAAGGTLSGTLRMMATAHALSLVALTGVLLLRGGMVFQTAPVVWGLGCGVVAGLSLAAFYIALARGAMGASAAISGLLAAAIPAAVGMILEGRPTALRSFGFLLAASAIWLVAAPPPAGAASGVKAQATTGLALGGGLGFGLYFTGLKFANPLGVLEPLALARIGSILTSLLLLFFLRGNNGGSRTERKTWLSRSGWLWAVGVALLDTGGNLLYIAATRAGRLDVAAVLASLYPASTILLAAGLLHERPSQRQLTGMAVAAVAVVLVSI